LELAVVGVEEDSVLEFVDPVVEGGEAWEEAVDEAIDDAIEQQRWLLDRLLTLLIAFPDLGERWASFAVDRRKRSE
jgi:hypothetical protein